MATDTSQVTAQSAQTGAAPQRNPAAEVANRMAVDIYEDSDGITLQADMPGVSKERLNVHVDGDSLLLEGTVQFDLPEQAKALCADIRSTHLSTQLRPESRA